MKNYDSIIIGHISMDTNTDHLGNSVHTEGGAVIYSSASAFALGHSVLAVHKLAAEDLQRVNAFTIPKEDVLTIISEHSTSISNHYLTADKERRICKCISQAEPFSVSEIPTDVKTDLYHLAGLIYGDFSDEMIKETAKLGNVAVDVQAMLRHKADNGDMYFEDWQSKKEILPYIRYLKTDAAEAEILTGLEDRYQAIKVLYGWGAKEILITHNTEVIAYDGGEIYACPIRARNLSGRTGRGDTTFAAYINERKNKSIKEALLYATATVSFKMETPGPLKANRSDIENYINEFYADLK